MPRARLKKKQRDDIVPATLRKWRENRTWREEDGKTLGTEYTQGHVAAVCGVALRTVQSWEQGHRKPGVVDLEKLEKLAHAYGVTVSAMAELLGWRVDTLMGDTNRGQ